MKKYLLFVWLAIFVEGVAFASKSQTIQVKDMAFKTDLENPKLAVGEQAVFPYSDEMAVLLDMAAKIKESRGTAFKNVVDPFCGDGKSGLPLIFHGIAEKLIGSDSNPRAIEYAKENAGLNHLVEKSFFSVRDITKEGLMPSNASGNTLWIANPPFALKAKGTGLELMRDGGENGLQLTLTFIKQSMALSKPGDVILGVGYSRIDINNLIELEMHLKRLSANCELILLKGQKLWRGFNGKKEQENPMPINGETFSAKADPSNSDEVAAYVNAAKYHNELGYNKLGYFAYVIYR